MPFPVSYAGTINLSTDDRNFKPVDLESQVQALRKAFLRNGESESTAENELVRFRVKWWVSAGPLWMIDKGELSLVPDDGGRIRFVLSFWRAIVPLAIMVVLVFGVFNVPFGMLERIIIPIVGFLWLVTPGYLFAIWRFSRFVRRSIR